MKNSILRLSALALLLLTPYSSFAWDHSVELGYGYSHDPNGTKYHNSGVLLSGDMFALKHTPMTFWSITGSLGRWHTTAPQNKNLTTAAVSLALRFYPFVQMTHPTYLLASFGPAVLASRKFGVNTQAKNVTFQSNLGLGMEFNPIDVNLRLVHYSNAYLAKPNQGFNILYLLSIGYLFG